eukprot:TRINITY_DN66466_c0_g1_i1.p1 TRINITY_DN66466_c0_g1~~TRINITY_DN66466_c0_g1_i1.p1  ORF type:complete len:546 (+),score=84.21 TRINITY_DN66466_c0_g1_i1:66-1640(+)
MAMTNFFGALDFQGSSAFHEAPERTLCALTFHSKLVALLLEKLDLPLLQLQELRLARSRQRRQPSDVKLLAQGNKSDWQVSASGGLYLTKQLRSPIWQRLWDTSRYWQSEAESGFARTSCFSREEAQLINEVEMQISCALRQIGHTTALNNQVLKLFTQVDTPSSPSAVKSTVTNPDEARLPENDITNSSAEQKQEVLDIDGEVAKDKSFFLTTFRSVEDKLCEASWAFFLHSQVVTAALNGDVVLLAAWSLRMLGLAGPWSLRRLHEFVVSCLELLVEFPQDAHGTTPFSVGSQLFLDSCAAYLATPVIPRLQARLRKCVSTLRERGLLRQEVSPSVDGLQNAISSLLGEGPEGSQAAAEFDGTGKNSKPFRDADPLFVDFKRTLRKSVVDRLDISCPLLARASPLSSLKVVSHLSQVSQKDQKLLLHVLAPVPQDEAVAAFKRLSSNGRNLERLEEGPVQDQLRTPRAPISPEDIALQTCGEISPVTFTPGSDGIFPFCCSSAAKGCAALKKTGADNFDFIR